MDCFNINSGYTDNELVKKDDITFRNKKVNHGIMYGDWEVKTNTFNLPIIVCNICNNLLYTPNEDITFNIIIIYYYKNASNDNISSGFVTTAFTHYVNDEETSLKTVTVNLRTVQENIQSVEIHVDQQPVDANYDYNIVTKDLDKIDSTKFSITNTSFKINYDVLKENETILGLQCDLYTNITCDNFSIDNVNAEIVESGNISNPYQTISKTFNTENNITTFSTYLEHNIINSGYNLKYFWLCYHLYYENVFDKYIYVISTPRKNTGIELSQLIENT